MVHKIMNPTPLHPFIFHTNSWGGVPSKKNGMLHGGLGWCRCAASTDAAAGLRHRDGDDPIKRLEGSARHPVALAFLVVNSTAESRAMMGCAEATLAGTQ